MTPGRLSLACLLAGLGCGTLLFLLALAAAGYGLLLLHALHPH